MAPREATAAEVVTVRPGDVIVLTFDRQLEHAVARRAQANAKRLWPNNEIVVMCQGRVVIGREELPDQ